MFSHKHFIALSALVLLSSMVQADSRSCDDGLDLQGARGTVEVTNVTLPTQPNTNGTVDLVVKHGCDYKVIQATICQNDVTMGYPQYELAPGVGFYFTVQEYLIRLEIKFCKKFCITPSVTFDFRLRTSPDNSITICTGPTNVIDLQPFTLPPGNFATIIPGFINLRDVSKRGFKASIVVSIAAPIVDPANPSSIPDNLLTALLTGTSVPGFSNPAQIHFHALIEADSCEKGCN